MRLFVAWCLACFAACAGELGPPRRQPLPEPDGVAPLRSPEPRSPRIANYRIEARYDPADQRIAASQTLTWTNTSAVAVDVLPFHLYMNAFAGDDTIFVREAQGFHRRSAAPESIDDWGGIALRSVRVDDGADQLDRVRYPAEDRTVAEVPLDRPVAPGERVRVAFEFEVVLPVVFARTGYAGAFAMVGQWFPKIGVLVDGRWHCEPFHLNSEFFADFGTYDVEITAPDTHVIAATGVLTDARDHDDGTRTHVFRAEDVHDFAWMADPYMDVLRGEARVDGATVEVRVYARPAQRAFAERHLHAAIGAVERFSELLVPYPYPILTVIAPPPEAALGAGGMEYATLVTTLGDHALLGPGVRIGELTTIHEVGHQWFQGILASNEVDEAWLDEGVNEYLDSVVAGELYGEHDAIDLPGWWASSLDLRRADPDLDSLSVPIRTVSYEFPTNDEYGAATYGKTALALATLEGVYGRDAFLAAMKAYAAEYAFTHPTGEQFFGALERSLGASLDWFVRPVFAENGTVAMEVRELRCDRTRCSALVVHTGDVAVPTEVEIETSTGAVRRVPWPREQRWLRIELDRAADGAIDRVTIDPDERVPLNTTPLRAARRRVPDRDASRRAGAGAQHWAQTLMQVTGL